MGTFVQIDQTVDNSNTLYTDYLLPKYNDLADDMLLNTKILRGYILESISKILEQDKTIFLKEPYDKPLFDYSKSNSKFSHELKTDSLIVESAFNTDKLSSLTNTPSLTIEALDIDNISIESWDNHIENIIENFKNVDKICLIDFINLIKKTKSIDTEKLNTIKTYLLENNRPFSLETYWFEIFSHITEKFWEKISFSLEINDFDIYEEHNKEILSLITDVFFKNGFIDEVVINMNYLYWFDDFEKILDFTNNTYSSLVSIKLNTLFSNEDKNRYYNSEQATLYGDEQRKNSMFEELEMFKNQLPKLIDLLLKNKQFYGLELLGGYFGKEGTIIKDIVVTESQVNDYLIFLCKINNTNPFNENGDALARVLTTPIRRMLVCILNKDNE